jgi:glycosyltransferase involved in cell wall biosynthesis
MRVGVNLIYLRPDGVGGGEVYCRSLVDALSRIDGVEIVLFCGSYATASLLEHDAEVVEVSERRFSQLGRLYDENCSIGRTEAIDEVDVLLSPANIAAPFLPKSVPQVVTIHDLYHEHHPMRFSPVRRWGRRFFVGTSLLRARRAIAVSEFTAADVRETYGAAAPSVEVVHEGVNRKEIPAGDEVERIVRRFELPDNFVFYPAVEGWHKNHEVLVEAFEQHLVGDGSVEVELVFCGRRTGEVDGLDRALERNPHVRHLGYVERREMLGVLSRAQALVFPSVFEGFGLPLVEAMACETPIIASRRAAIPEVVRDAGLLLEPHDTVAWAEAIRRIVRDGELRRELVQRGLERVEHFSWERAARQTLEVLREAAAG